MTPSAPEKIGYRGYIASRPVRGETTPQHVQNLVIRDYASRMKLQFKLSATEYAMPGCYMILGGVMEELPTLEGVICFTLFMLPQGQAARLRVYRSILDAKCILHTALEGLVMRSERDIELLEDIFKVQQFSALAR